MGSPYRVWSSGYWHEVRVHHYDYTRATCGLYVPMDTVWHQVNHPLKITDITCLDCLGSRAKGDSDVDNHEG